MASLKQGTNFAKSCLDWIVGAFLSVMDFLNRLGTPFFGGLAGVSGLMWDQDFPSYLGKSFPNWSGLGTLLSEWLPIVTITATFATAFCALLGIITQKSVGKIKEELKAEREKVTLIANNIEAVVDGLLLQLSEKLAFDNGEPSRITIYVHNGRSEFVSFGRYSPDPILRHKGRAWLPESEGCIAAAWRSNWCYEGNLLAKDAKSKYKVSVENIDQRKMKSVFYAVKRIDSGVGNNPLAVLVVESAIKTRFEQGYVKEILIGEEAYFAEIISSLREHIPDPSQAGRSGF